MSPASGQQSIANDRLEAQAIKLDMNMDEIGEVLWNGLAQVPFAIGVNNHMGSLITQHPGHMQWLMQWLHGTDLFFVDSKTSEQSVAEQIAKQNNIPSISRDVFLDHDPNPAAIARQYDQLLQIAREQGVALAIGHPYPATLKLLAKRLPLLKKQGIRLVGVSALLR